MCGIAGMLRGPSSGAADEAPVRVMLAALRHRGPDDEGIHSDGPVCLGSRRLSVVDLAGGHQPVSNEDGSIWVSFNGEIFSHGALRKQLESEGHRFRSRCDTEVLTHLYERDGDLFVEKLDGQFALALWDSRRRRLILARDHMGIRPLFHATVGDTLYWASEIKALLAVPEIPARMDVRGLQHVFWFAAPTAPLTAFEGIEQLPPGQMMIVESGRSTRRTWWDMKFAPVNEPVADLGEAHYVSGVRQRLESAVASQLMADVPVGVYLSGGLDSSVLAALVGHVTGAPPRTFSLGFQDGFFDERPHARAAVRHLSAHSVECPCDDADVARGLPRAVQATEHPSLLTEMVPLMHLSRRAREDVTVVVTGEGADEAFGGYQYFRVDRVRRWLSRFPGNLMAGIARAGLRSKFGTDHVLPTAGQSAEVEAQFGFYPAMQFEFEVGRQLLASLASEGLAAGLGGRHPAADLELPAALRGWHPFDQATYLAYRVRLANHQVSPLGDRVTNVNSVEGRYPFLDHRLVEFAATIPHRHKVRWTWEKYVLRRVAEQLLPRDLAWRRKQQFQAPLGSAFVGERAPDYVRELLSPGDVRRRGYFDPTAVSEARDTLLDYQRRWPARVDYPRVLAELSVVAVLTTHLFDEIFMKNRGVLRSDWAQLAPGIPWVDR